MRRVAVAGFASTVLSEGDGRNDAEILAPVVTEAITASGIDPADIDILATASSEFLNGVVGGIMGAFDALPGWPPRTHSHLEADGAFALYEAWVRLMAGGGRAALVGSFSRPLARPAISPLTMQLDPYRVAPLAPSPVALAALQARVMIDSGRYRERDFATVVAARRAHQDVDALLEQPYVASPLREADCSTVCSGAAAMVLATEDGLPAAVARPAWITGIDHRIERHALGARDLSVSATTQAIARRLGLAERTIDTIDVLEVHAPFSHQELLVVDALGAGRVAELNPSGGALPADPLMSTGLIRIGAAAAAILTGTAVRAAGHATNGPCLQHNLVCVMEADR
jgi:acetyl-CoA acetyltransferase